MTAPFAVIRHAFGMRHSPTPAERALWRMLRHEWRSALIWGLRRQVIVRAPWVEVSGRRHTWVILDLAYTRARLALELDGSQHYTTAGSANDTRRTAALQRLGWTVHRWPNSAVFDRPRDVHAAIRAALRGRLWWRLECAFRRTGVGE